MAPSSPPSSQPSVHPSKQPTTTPTSQPTFNPTSPSSQPTRQPTTVPSETPSVQPTSQPTGQPFSLPSSRPSRQPVGRPSSQPTIIPSSQPTGRPSCQPTTSPTVLAAHVQKPTSQPTGVPSALPTVYLPNVPVITVPLWYRHNLEYLCHPLHPHSSESRFQQIFGVTNIVTKAPISTAVVWIDPYDPSLDLFSMTGKYDQEAFSTSISNGTVVISSINSQHSLEEWANVIKKASYKLGAQVSLRLLKSIIIVSRNSIDVYSEVFAGHIVKENTEEPFI